MYQTPNGRIVLEDFERYRLKRLSDAIEEAQFWEQVAEYYGKDASAETETPKE